MKNAHTTYPSEAFRRQLVAARQRQGLRQADIAARLRDLGVVGGIADQSAIARIERGRRPVSLDEAFQIAAALGVAPLHLFADDEADVRIAPKLDRPTADFRAWARGERPLSGEDWRAYYMTIVPADELDVALDRLAEFSRAGGMSDSPIRERIKARTAPKAARVRREKGENDA